MPELPEVQTIVDAIKPDLVGKQIDHILFLWKNTSMDGKLSHYARNQKIRNVTRRGKYIVIHLERGNIGVHLRMTGKFISSYNAITTPKHIRARIHLTDGSILYFQDKRKFGKFYWIPKYDTFFDRIGYEPLADSFTKEQFVDAIYSKSRQIKSLLLDQTIVAGLGNIYVDEALFRAKIHPSSQSTSVPREQLYTLFDAIRQVLKEGIAHHGTTISDYQYGAGKHGQFQHKINVYGKKGQTCGYCGSEILKIKVYNRNSHFCPSCQILYTN